MNGLGHSIKRWAIALGVGTLVGAALVATFGFFSAGRSDLMPPDASATISFMLSLFYAPAIIILCAPVWYVISWRQMDGPVAAIVLGFVMTSAVWFWANRPFWGPAWNDWVIGFCGAVAGLTTWWVATKVGAYEGDVFEHRPE